MSTEHPILFSAPMVRAILAGQKTVTRRLVKPQPPAGCDRVTLMPLSTEASWHNDASREKHPAPRKRDGDAWMRCPYGSPGDRLWVRETWRADDYDDAGTIYVADLPAELFEEAGDLVKWRPSIHMPRNRSRLTLAVEEVRVERLHAIDEADAVREGLPPRLPEGTALSGNSSARQRFEWLWDHINGTRAPWASNPWVWRVQFRRLP